MTVIVGILCVDGVVIASDSYATFGVSGMSTIGQQDCRKIYPLANSLLYTSTGAVGIAQMLSNFIEREWNKSTHSAIRGKGTPEETVEAIAQEINKRVGPFLHTATFQKQCTGDAGESFCKSILAFPFKKSAYLCQFAPNGAPELATKELPFVALGSGQVIADPFLANLKRLLWHESAPTIGEGRLAAIWTVEHVRQTNPGGVGGPIRLATLAMDSSNPKIAFLDDQEVGEHLQQIQAAEQALVAELVGSRLKQDVTLPPDPPT